MARAFHMLYDVYHLPRTLPGLVITEIHYVLA